MSKLFKRSSLALMLLVVGVFFFKVVFDDRSNGGAGVSDAGGSYDGVGSGAGQGSPDDFEENTEEVFPAISMINEQGPPSPMERAFSFELPLLEGINQMALSGEWSYDKKVKNVALWEGLCQAREARISDLVDGTVDAERVHANLNQLCQNFSSIGVEIDEFLDVYIEERAFGVNESAALETSLDELGPDAATVLAISELSRALGSLDYASAVEVVWFLGIYNFDGVSEEFAVYRRQPSVETIFAVSAAVFCNSIGGCGRSHPIVLNLCFQFHDLPCSRRPANIYDAVDQILTGYELETFNEMNTALVRLLNRYRRGDL